MLQQVRGYDKTSLSCHGRQKDFMARFLLKPKLDPKNNKWRLSLPASKRELLRYG
jgi:hypothetical protein